MPLDSRPSSSIDLLVHSRMLISQSRDAIARSHARVAESLNLMRAEHRQFHRAWDGEVVSDGERAMLLEATDAGQQQAGGEREIRDTLRNR